MVRSAQQRIVAQLEEERRLVAANKALVERMDAKVRERVARMWGEGPGDQPIGQSGNGQHAEQALPSSERS